MLLFKLHFLSSQNARAGITSIRLPCNVKRDQTKRRSGTRSHVKHLRQNLPTQNKQLFIPFTVRTDLHVAAQRHNPNANEIT